MKPIRYCLLWLLIIVALFSCTRDNPVIMTVNGPLDPTEMGVTLPHEHFMVDFIGADKTGYSRWNRDSVIRKVLPFLIEAKQAGVKTIVECTPAYLGRDPLLLKALSDSTGLNILTNTGYYGAFDNKALPAKAYEMTADQMAEEWINEWKNGIEGTGIKPGFIKIAVLGDTGLDKVHENLVRAAARASLKTGLTINSHTGPDALAIAEMRILKEEGVDPSAFIWTHAQAGTSQTHIRLAREGCWISLDNVMTDNIAQYVSFLEVLKRQNLLNRVLLSHDAGWYDVINPDSVTYRGHTAIFTHLKPALLQAGFTESDWQLLTVTNPREAYTIRHPLR
jgi:phosphotriesterase-related protein